MFKRFAIALAFMSVGQAFAEVPYIDNRSTASDVVSSLYNAINRKEYARAWSYFTTPPAKSFDDYVAGYSSTANVELQIGTVGAEGAAGSSFYSVPVAIRSKDTAGEERIFAGCYTVRQVSAQIQDPPFNPLHIESGKLKVSTKQYLEDALPDCGGGQPNAAEVIKQEAINLFRASYGKECDAAGPDRAEPLEPEIYSIRFRYDYETTADQEHEVTLLQFPCSMYAYNYSSVYFRKLGTAALEFVSFASPDVKSTVEGEENQTLKALSISGFDASLLLINSEFNTADNSISFFAKGRGIGDISSSGTYSFREGNFILTDFAYDATGNGEIDPVDLIVQGKTVEPKF